MAPEQIEGHPRPASDQYALGVVVYEWLCGERPFEGSVSELIAQHLSMPPLPLRERVPAIPVEVEQVVLRTLAKDPKARFASVTDFATALEHASSRALAPTARFTGEPPPPGLAAATSNEAVTVAPGQPVLPAESIPSADLPVGALEQMVYPSSATPHGHDTPQSGAASGTPQRGRPLEPAVAAMPVPAGVPLLPTPPTTRQHRRATRRTAVLLIGLVVVIIVGGILGSLSLLTHFGVLGARSGTTTPVRGGTWTLDYFADAGSFIPNGASNLEMPLQALYLPLFYGDAQGVIQPGAATEVPTVQNGGISADARTWTFHLRPHLVWSDGQSYDARDVDFTWKLWKNPKFGALTPLPSNLISSAAVSADDLSITFHLTQSYAPFLQYWVDGVFAPLPAHHFSSMAPEAILQSPENLNPKVTSGPFMMSESKPSDHYTLVRNPRYYRARQGLPYLDKLVFRIVMQDAQFKDPQAGTATSFSYLDPSNMEYQRLKNYTLVIAPTSNSFEALSFNLHNTLLAKHPEVRLAMAMAIDHQALIKMALHGFAQPLCTDHPSAMHPGYDPNPPCTPFDPAAANKLLSDNGWVKGPDGVRSKNGQRLEFEYSTNVQGPAAWRLDTQAIIQQDLQAVSIKLDIQNYTHQTFFGPFLTWGKASPPTGAVAGRYHIAEWQNGYLYDPDDSSTAACDQFPPQGQNFSFYCNHALDALFRQEQAAPDPGVRQGIFDQIHQILLTELPFIVLYSNLGIALVHKGTHNYQINPFEGEGINVWEWWCDHGEC
jgi:peptide/nickel transport system substrate-binding protein